MISELNEDDDGIGGGNGHGHTLEELQKTHSKFGLSKGLARMSLMIGAERHSAGKGCPKKAINRVSYRFFEVLLDPETKPEVFLGYFKELHDRMDGKPQQAIVPQNPDGTPLTVQIVKLSDLAGIANADDPAT